jgi:serine/threonine protein kinase
VATCRVSRDVQTDRPALTVTRVHQDIQPANILVFPQKDKSAPFDVRFKLTDFGLAEIGRVSTSTGTMVTENRGNRMYSEFLPMDHSML